MVFYTNLFIVISLSILIFAGIIGLFFSQDGFKKISFLIVSYLSSLTLIMFFAIIYQKQNTYYILFSVLLLFIVNLLVALRFLKK